MTVLSSNFHNHHEKKKEKISLQHSCGSGSDERKYEIKAKLERPQNQTDAILLGSFLRRIQHISKTEQHSCRTHLYCNMLFVSDAIVISAN